MTAVSGMNGELAEIFGCGQSRSQELCRDHEGGSIYRCKQQECIKASREMCSAETLHTSSEGSTSAKSDAELEGAETWSRLHAKHS